MLNLDVKPGEFRHLSQHEVAKFRELLKMDVAEDAPEAGAKAPKVVSQRPPNRSKETVRAKSAASPKAAESKPKRRSVAKRGGHAKNTRGKR